MHVASLSGCCAFVRENLGVEDFLRVIMLAVCVVGMAQPKGVGGAVDAIHKRWHFRAAEVRD